MVFTVWRASGATFFLPVMASNEAKKSREKILEDEVP